MNIFDLSIEDIQKVLDESLSGYTADELLDELVECGLEVDDNDSDDSARYEFYEDWFSYLEDRNGEE